MKASLKGCESILREGGNERARKMNRSDRCRKRKHHCGSRRFLPERRPRTRWANKNLDGGHRRVEIKVEESIRRRRIGAAPRAWRSAHEDEHPGCRVGRDGGALASRRLSARATIKGATCAAATAATRRHTTRPAALEEADVRRHGEARKASARHDGLHQRGEAKRGEARKEQVSNAW